MRSRAVLGSFSANAVRALAPAGPALSIMLMTIVAAIASAPAWWGLLSGWPAAGLNRVAKVGRWN